MTNLRQVLDFFEKTSFNFVQLIIRILARPLIFLLSDVEVMGNNATKSASKPVLIISNHKSYFDPLLISYSLPLRFKAYPLRFIAKDELFVKSTSRLMFYLMGSFPAFKGQGIEKSLAMPRKILKEGGSVVFFPEGQCVREDGLLPKPKAGAAILALNFPSIQILPMAIHNSFAIGHRGFFGRPKVKIFIGEPFYLKDKVDPANASVEAVSEVFLKELAKLYEKLSPSKIYIEPVQILS